MSGMVTCSACGKKESYDKYAHPNPSNFVCYACRTKHAEQKVPSINGFYCLSPNSEGNQLQSCWCCEKPVATQFVKFTYTIGSKEQEYWFYTCEECYKTYGKLNGRTFNLSKEPNFPYYRQEVQLKYLLQFCK
jgi:hypothetical protein